MLSDFAAFIGSGTGYSKELDRSILSFYSIVLSTPSSHAKKLGPQDPKFYDVPAEQLVRERLPGVIVRTPEELVVVELAHGFKDLIRGQMRFAYDRKDRKPGDIVPVKVRGAVLLNVSGSTSGDPQLVWLENLVTPGGADVKGNALVRRIAEGMGGEEASAVNRKGGTVDFAMRVLDGINVTNPTSPIQFFPNDAHPNPGIKYIGPNPSEAPSNDAGTGVVSTNVIENVESPDLIRRTIEREALRLESAIAPRIKDLPAGGNARLLALVGYLLDPKHLTWVLKQSPVMKLLLKSAARNSGESQ